MLENKYKFQSVGQALKNISKIFKNKGIINSKREAEILLSYSLEMSRSEIYLNSDRALKDIEKKQLEKKIQKRIDKIPLQYITKHQEFIDLGTGTGIIAVSIAKFIEDIIIYATDISKISLQIALKNAQKHYCKDKIIFLQGDLFEPFIGRIEKNSLDGIISNPPYIDSYDFKSLPTEIKNNEPKIALFGGIDGLDYYRKIIKKSPQYLKKNGFLALEVGLNQSQAVEELILKENNFNQNIEITKDYLGIERVVIAHRK